MISKQNVAKKPTKGIKRSGFEQRNEDSTNKIRRCHHWKMGDFRSPSEMFDPGHPESQHLFGLGAPKLGFCVAFHSETSMFDCGISE